MKPGRTLLSIVTLAALSASVQAEELRELVDRIQTHYDGVEAFQARFTQRHERRLLRKVVEESGTVFVKKPGRMRWEYETPEEKLFLTNGEKSYFYLPMENQVIISNAPSGAMGMGEGSPFELLVGRSRLTDTFEAFPSDSPPTEGGVMLSLVPLRPQAGFDEVEIEVEPSNGQIRRVVLLDAQHNKTEFVFDDIRENVELPESRFRFTVPSGVDVVLASQPPVDGL